MLLLTVIKRGYLVFLSIRKMVDGLSRISPRNKRKEEQADCLSNPRTPEETILSEDDFQAFHPCAYGHQGLINPSSSVSDEVESWEDPYEAADEVLKSENIY